MKVCRSSKRSPNKTQVNLIPIPQTTNSDMDEDVLGEHLVHSVFTVGSASSSASKLPQCQISVGDEVITTIIDTGATINIMANEQYNRLKIRPTLQSTKTTVFAYGQPKPLLMRGKFETVLGYHDKAITSVVYVTGEGKGMLLGCKSAEALGIMSFAFGIHHEGVNQITQEFAKVFEGIGCLMGKQVRLHIDPTVRPVALRHRRLAFHLRPLIEKELQNLEDAGIIEKVKGPTPWVSPIVVARKPKQPGEVRICVDMRLPNAATKRESHLTPMIDDRRSNWRTQ